MTSIGVSEPATSVEIESDSPPVVTIDGDVLTIVEAPGLPTTVVIDSPPTSVVETEPETVQVVETVEVVQLVSVGIAGPAGPTGPEGPPGAAGAAPQAYVHDQQVPTDVWTIDHNLGFSPNVEVIDTLGEVCVGEISYPTVNRTVLVFSAAFSGIAYLS